MSHPVRSTIPQWRTRICFTLAGLIFVLSQIAVAPPADRPDIDVIRTADTLPAPGNTDDTETD
jgi:hypothetical protein